VQAAAAAAAPELAGTAAAIVGAGQASSDDDEEDEEEDSESSDSSEDEEVEVRTAESAPPMWLSDSLLRGALACRMEVMRGTATVGHALPGACPCCLVPGCGC
jgi:hypothetical protein